MPIQNAEIATVLNEIADLLDIQGGNPFRIRAYRNAARTVAEVGRSVPAMVARQAGLDALPGIGPDLAAKITEIVTTGSCALLERLRKELGPGISELLKVPGLGPTRIRTLYRDLGVQTLAQLHLAAQEGRVQAIAGFGPKLQQALLEATAARLREERRFALGVADETAAALLAGLAAVPGVARAVAAGSLRRRRETVGDLDLLVGLDGESAVMERFIHGEEVRQVLLHGGTRASVVLKSGLQVDLRAVPAQSFGAAWVYFTGSKAHNIALRRLAQEQGLKVNEYGVFRGVERIAGATEASLYQALGLRYIEPELREDRGEIEAARQDRLPLLVTLADLRGDLHLHTRDSDGQGSLEAMAAEARARGWRYAAVTDHSRSPAFARGLDPVRLAKQIDRIDRFNEKAQGFTVLKGIEVDILQDGTLELPDSVLQRLDLVVGAVHYRFELPRAQQTERVLRAMDSRYFTLLAHPTGRLIGERAPCEIDLLRVLRKARERGCFVELNAQPARLDLADTACQMAKAEGVLVSINSDAHGTLEFNHLPSGIDQGRRGWLETADVLNTRDLPELRPLLARTMR